VTAVAKARAEKREEKREADEHAKDKKKKKGKEDSDELAEDEGEEDAEDTEFKLLSAAWELLGNAESRRTFDSIDYFNDYLPSSYKRARPDDPPTRFFDTFGPPFARQSKFSTTQPTPPLGDADTPYEEVAQFYRFWQTSYKSWRDFSLLSEHKISEATSREEKRWMQRQNQNQADRVKKDESKRVSAFIALAQEHDPRVLKYREEVAAKKAAAKEAKEAAVRAEQEAKEAELRAKAEADAIVEAAAAKEKAAKDDVKAAAKREKEKLRSALKKARKDLKALGELPRWASRVGDLEAAAAALAIEEIEALKTAMTSGDDAVADAALAAALKKAMG
jgi:DnaJ family protein C protein 2